MRSQASEIKRSWNGVTVIYESALFYECRVHSSHYTNVKSSCQVAVLIQGMTLRS